MKKLRKKRKKNFNQRLKVKSKKQTILPVLFGIALLSLFSETLQTVPAGAKSENFRNLPFELPSLNSDIFEEKFINKNLIVDENSKNYD
ncbi:MAG: hypothetical protein CMI71_04260, partial [Candidatus Pelagibacter sp.]|nr:hypothetical protein [Candidatus Pelagibacter sp.]